MTDEKALIRRAQQGEMDAFRLLVEQSKANVYRLAYDLTGSRHDAEDLTQEVFVKAFRSLASFRGDAAWGTWIYRITVNACHDHRKRMKPTDEYDDEDEAGAGDGREPGPDRRAEADVMKRHIDEALGRLPQREREVFVLRHYHDLPLKEIAESLKLAEGTVKSHLFRAIQQLRRELAFYRSDLGLETRQ